MVSQLYRHTFVPYCVSTEFFAVLCLYLHWKRVLWKWRTRKTEELKLDILENERQTRNRILGPIIWQTEKWLDFLDFVATLIITYQIIAPTQCFVTTWRSCTTRNVCDLSHTHPFNGPLSGTTRVSRYQKGKNQSGFYWSKRQWVAVASAGLYASLHLAPDR